MTNTRPTILVDIDDTLAVFSEEFWETHNKLYKEGINHLNITDWDLTKFSSQGTATYDLFKHPGLFRRLKKKYYSEQFIENIQSFCNLYLVTDSPSGTGHGETVEFKNSTINFSNPTDDKRLWVKEYFPSIPKENIIICSCKWMIKGDILVDDKPDTFLRFEQEGGKAILMDMPYNRHIQTKYRAKDLKEAEKMIYELLSIKSKIS